jgi:hypothetical protein
MKLISTSQPDRSWSWNRLTSTASCGMNDPRRKTTSRPRKIMLIVDVPASPAAS